MRKSSRKSVRKQRKRGGSSQKKDKIDLKKYVVLKQKDVNLLYDITKKTIDILDKHGVEYWATDGTLLGMTYHREEDVIAWHRHIFGGSNKFIFWNVSWLN